MLENLLPGGLVFIFGTSIGSFLNVVIYRLPAGLSLLSPPSRCPKCLT
ncbi:MAG: prepilin peptidase, partial [Cyanobacteria bacterium P01_F01_bin.116]